MEDHTPEEMHGETLAHLTGDEMIVRDSQIGRLEAAHVDAARSQIGSLASDRVQISDSKVGFLVARELQSNETEAGILIAFRNDGTINTQVDARQVVLAASVAGLAIFLLGRLFRRG